MTPDQIKEALDPINFKEWLEKQPEERVGYCRNAYECPIAWFLNDALALNLNKERSSVGLRSISMVRHGLHTDDYIPIHSGTWVAVFVDTVDDVVPYVEDETQVPITRDQALECLATALLNGRDL